MRNLILTALVATSSLVVAKPNVILIYSDDHGYTDLGAYGIDGNVDTPHMDALARGGALMTAGYSSAPQCRPSRCGLLAGRIQNEFGFADNKTDAGAGVGTLPRVYPPGTDMAGQPLLTIADRMKQLGYVTGFSGKWHCGPNEDKEKKFDPRGRGFDEYWVAPMTTGYTNLDLDGNRIAHQKKSDWPNALQNRVILQGKMAEAFVKRNKAKPFFLYFPIFGPHVPMIKKTDPYYTNFPKRDYSHYSDTQDDIRRQGLALIKAMDDAVGGIVETLRELGLQENTLIMFAGDNGAPGKLTATEAGSWNGSNNVPMRGPKGSLHEGGIRVPMFAHWNGTIRPGQVIRKMVTTLDLTATTLAVGGGSIPGEFDGVNLMPRLTGKATAICAASRCIGTSIPARLSARATGSSGEMPKSRSCSILPAIPRS
jgi:arylsulfatase A-like enzyme